MNRIGTPPLGLGPVRWVQWGMSIKIYNGYRLPGHNLEQALGVVRAFQAKLLPQVEERRLRLSANFLTRELDARRLDRPSPLGVKEGESLSWVVADLFREEDVRRRKHSDDEDSVSRKWAAEECVDPCAVMLYPGKKGTLAQIFTPVREFEQLWAAMAEVEDYHYQNQTDQPSNVSARAWKQRGLDWEAAFQVGDRTWVPPKYSGLTCETVEPLMAPLALADILAKQASHEQRVQRWTMELAENAWTKEQLDAAPIGTDRDVLGRAMSLHRQWQVYAKTPEGERFVARIRDDVGSRLPGTWTPEDVKGFRRDPAAEAKTQIAGIKR